MPVTFPGTPVYHTLISGPANLDDITGPSVSDMGTLLADRDEWLRAQILTRLIPVAFRRFQDDTTATADAKGFAAWTPTGIRTAAFTPAVGDVLLAVAPFHAFYDGPPTDRLEVRLDLRTDPGLALTGIIQTGPPLRIPDIGTTVTSPYMASAILTVSAAVPQTVCVSVRDTGTATSAPIGAPSGVFVLQLRPVV